MNAIEQKNPPMRFSEFHKPWLKYTLSDVSSFISKGTTPSHFSEDGVRFVKIESLKGVMIDESKCLFIDYNTHQKELRRSILQEGDLLFAIAGATVGKTGIVTSDILPANTNQALAIIRLKDKSQVPFLIHVLTSRKMKRYIFLSMSVGAQPNLALKQINDFEFSAPSVEEQQKIASFLTAIDTKIEQLTQKVELLQQYKKGVMQQLFTQKLRFKDDIGNDYPDWEEKKLGEIAKVKSSKRVLQQDWLEQGIPFYRTREIIALSEGESFRTPIFISEEMYSTIAKRYGLPKPGDILVTGVGTIGKTYTVKEKDEFYFKDGNVLWIDLSRSQVNSNFLAHLFNSRLIRKQLSDNASITTVATFTIEGANNTTIPYPCLKEQIKIANFLSAIDAKIELVQTQLENTRQFKKGLLQQMFV